MKHHLLALFLIIAATPANAGDATGLIGASCAGNAEGAEQAHANGIYVCTSGVWVAQPILHGASSADCDTDIEGLTRYNSTSKVLEYCNGTTWKLVVNTPSAPADQTPAAFGFTDVTDQSLGAMILSNAVNITGIDSGVTVTVTGSGSPQININGTGWVTAGTINSGETLQVRLVSSTSASTPYVATVTVGDTADDWSVTTRAGQLKVFRTANTYTGNLGGLAGADAICQSEAATLGYAGSYKAILSDSTADAKDRLTLAYPIVRAADGVVIEAVNLWDGSIQAYINYTSSLRVWSGSNSDGTVASTYHCSDWSIGTGGNGRFGSTDSYATSTWIANSQVTCNFNYYLYCLQQ